MLYIKFHNILHDDNNEISLSKYFKFEEASTICHALQSLADSNIYIIVGTWWWPK